MRPPVLCVCVSVAGLPTVQQQVDGVAYAVYGPMTVGGMTHQDSRSFCAAQTWRPSPEMGSLDEWLANASTRYDRSWLWQGGRGAREKEVPWGLAEAERIVWADAYLLAGSPAWPDSEWPYVPNLFYPTLYSENVSFPASVSGRVC